LTKTSNSIFNKCSNPQQPQPIQHYHQQALEIYKFERANKNMATEHGLYSTIRIIHNGYYLKKMRERERKRERGQLETAQSSPWSISSNAQNCKTHAYK
jgi:hypothetical protein